MAWCYITELATLGDHLVVESKDREIAEDGWHRKHSAAINRLE